MPLPFPFELPSATVFYLVLYLLTFVLHVVFMHYVVAGSLYVLWSSLRKGTGAPLPSDEPLAAMLRDWLPFVLSAAITAGVAPLLFMQILYRHPFYSANLLLGWRWMLIIPLLITGFYLLYLLKTRVVIGGSRWLRVLVAGSACICFLAIGMLWSVNHLVSLQPERWPAMFSTGRLPLAFKTTLPRVGIWLGGSFASMAMMAGWQLFAKARDEGQPSWEPAEVRRLMVAAWASIAVAMGSAMAYVLLAPSVRHAAMSLNGISYTTSAFCGAVIQVIGWWIQRHRGRLHLSGMTLVTIGAVFSLLGVATVREVHRLNTIGLSDSLVAAHQRAAAIGGFELFLVFAALNAGLVAFCIYLVWRSRPQGQGLEGDRSAPEVELEKHTVA